MKTYLRIVSIEEINGLHMKTYSGIVSIEEINDIVKVYSSNT